MLLIRKTVLDTSDSVYDNIMTLFFLVYSGICGCFSSSQQSVNILDTVSHVDKYQKSTLECHMLAYPCNKTVFSIPAAGDKDQLPQLLCREII